MNGEKFPLVSICIPTYQGEKYLLDALYSAANQTYQNIEIVVSDDASTDKTLSILNEFKNKVLIPMKIYHHTPQGIGANWNNCIKYANGSYIKFLFQDDILMPNCVEEMVKYALKFDSIGLVYCKRKIIYERLDKYTNIWLEKYAELHQNWHKITIIDGEKISGKKLLKNKFLLIEPENKIGEPTAVLIKKSVFNQVGYFSETLKQALDIEYWLRIMKHFDFVFVNKELAAFRIHTKQASVVNNQNGLNEMENFYLSIYNQLFYYLNFQNQLNFFYKFTKLGRFLKKNIYLFFYQKRQLSKKIKKWYC